jgi:hypothetical protein
MPVHCNGRENKFLNIFSNRTDLTLTLFWPFVAIFNYFYYLKWRVLQHSKSNNFLRMRTRKPRSNLGDVINERDRWDFHTLEEIAQWKHLTEHGWCSHTSLLLTIRSDQRCKWRCLRVMHTYSAPMTPPSWYSEIWWSGRWDRQHDGMVSMVESMRRQSYACLRGEKRTKKGHRVPSDRVPFIGASEYTSSFLNTASAAAPLRGRQEENVSIVLSSVCRVHREAGPQPMSKGPNGPCMWACERARERLLALSIELIERARDYLAAAPFPLFFLSLFFLIFISLK